MSAIFRSSIFPRVVRSSLHLQAKQVSRREAGTHVSSTSKTGTERGRLTETAPTDYCEKVGYLTDNHVTLKDSGYLVVPGSPDCGSLPTRSTVLFTFDEIHQRWFGVKDCAYRPE